MKTTQTMTGVTLLALALPGCGASYYAEQTLASHESGAKTTTSDGKSSEGELRVGSARLEREGRGGDGRQLRIRLAVDNRSGAAWRIDPRQQRVELLDGAQLVPAPREALTVAPGERASMTLAYPLPADRERPAQLPSFIGRWRVDVADGTLQAWTLFGRPESGPTMPCGADADWYCLSGYAGG